MALFKSPNEFHHVCVGLLCELWCGVTGLLAWMVMHRDERLVDHQPGRLKLWVCNHS